MNSFLSKIKKNQEKGIAFTSILILVGILLAGTGALISVKGLDYAEKLGLAIVGMFISTIAYVFSFLFALAVDISVWIMKISMSIAIVTDSAGNPSWAYTYGWTLVRDLVNMFFIIILVVIGIATILRIEEYRLQKALPKLIIIALLVNFSPVIVGVVVDIFNVLTNFFIENMTLTESFGASFEPINEIMKDLFSGIAKPTETAGDYMGRLFGLIIIAAYYAFGCLAFLLIGTLYVFRVIAFWVLLILSPLAFISYILPATRRWWTMWWSQLIQWGMIGLTTAFFLYLSSHLLANAGEIFKAKEMAAEIGEIEHGHRLAEIITEMMPYAISLVMMLIGLMLGLFSGAMGANQIVSGAKKGGKWVGKSVSRGTLGTARGLKPISKAEEKTRKWLETKPLVGRLIGGVGGYEKEKMKKMTELAKPYEKLPIEEIERILKTRPGNYNDRLKQAGLVEHLAKRGELHDDVKDRIIKTAKAFNMYPKEILERRPDWAPAFGKTIEETLRRQEPEEVRKKMQIESAKNIDVAIHLLLDKAKYDELTKGRMGLKGVIVDTIKNPPAGWTMPSQYEEILQDRINKMANDPKWPLEARWPSKTQQPKISHGTEEEFREARKKHGPKAFG